MAISNGCKQKQRHGHAEFEDLLRRALAQPLSAGPVHRPPGTSLPVGRAGRNVRRGEICTETTFLLLSPPTPRKIFLSIFLDLTFSSDWYTFCSKIELSNTFEIKKRLQDIPVPI